MEIEFVYNSFSPAPYSIPQRNVVTVWVEAGQIHTERRYVKGGQTEPRRAKGDGIQHVFPAGSTAEEVATLIHWGCSGTSRNALQLRGLIAKVQPLVDSLSQPV